MVAPVAPGTDIVSQLYSGFERRCLTDTYNLEANGDLGEGCFGMVRLCTRKDDGTRVAVKMIKDLAAGGKELARLTV
ncbi:hypothetical protein KIPB_014130, partial [Kipferlia bialata]|eukprot:g14130.t1